MTKQIDVTIELGDNVIEKLSAKEIAQWAGTVVPALLKGEQQENKYLVAGIMSLMDTVSDMTDFIASDSALLDSYIAFHNFKQEEDVLH